MKFWICLLILFLLFTSSSMAQETVPTLVPPTPLPTVEAGENDILLTESTVARIINSRVIRVGILFNEPPFGELTIRGDVAGFDADLARLLAETWDVEVNFVQVTRQNDLELLQNGEVDLLIAAQVHRRELDAVVEFSQSYYIGKQALMVQADSGIERVVNLSGRRVGYVLGTEGETAVQEALVSVGLPVTPQAYLTLDKAYVALFSGEIDGIVASEERLLRVAINQPDATKILDEPVAPEPYAVVMRRHDIHLRNLVNRTLQYLSVEDSARRSKLGDLREKYFPGREFLADALPIWKNVGSDAPKPEQFGTDVPYPQQYVAPNVKATGVLRVAGVIQPQPEAAVWRQSLYTLNRSVVERLAQRWGVRVEYLAGDALQLVESGQADLAAGVAPDWGAAGRVDFTQPYMLHGDRLMVLKTSNIDSFGSRELINRWIAVVNTDEGAQERAQAWADSVNVRVQFYIADEDEIASSILVENNADVAYADSLLLLPALIEHADRFVLTDRWYSRNYLAFAVPRNDLEFRLLVEYTLQDMVKAGELAPLLQPLTPPGGEPPSFDVYPGSREIAGFSIS